MALEQAGYLLAQGDRRDYVLIDRKGGLHSLARRIDGMKAAELREFMAPQNPERVPTVAQAQELQAEHERRVREAQQAHDAAPNLQSAGLSEVQSGFLWAIAST